LLTRPGYLLIIHVVVIVDSTVGMPLLRRDGVPHFRSCRPLGRILLTDWETYWVPVTHVVQRLGHSCYFCYELWQNNCAWERTNNHQRWFYTYNKLFTERKKIKLTTFRANNHSTAPTATLLLTRPTARTRRCASRHVTVTVPIVPTCRKTRNRIRSLRSRRLTQNKSPIPPTDPRDTVTHAHRVAHRCRRSAW